jgi:hypothetical protein
MTLNVSINESFKEGIKNHITRILDYKEPVVDDVKEDIITEVDVAPEISVDDVETKENAVKKTYYTPKKSRKPRNSEVD